MSADNEKRLQSLKRKKASAKNEQNLIKASLRGVGGNKKIKFDEDECGRELKTEEIKGKKSLFEQEGDDDPEEQLNDERILSNFNENKSERLIELQSRFAFDERFKVDERFVDDEDGGDQVIQDDGTRELDRTMSILEQVIGKPLDQSIEHAGKSKSKREEGFVATKTLLIPRYDPSKPEEAEKYKRRKAKDRTKKETSDITNVVDKKVQFVEQVEVATIIDKPLSSNERHYEVSSNLKEVIRDAMAKKSSNSEGEGSQSFGFNKLFGNNEREDINRNEEYKCKLLSGKSSGNAFRYDSSDDDVDDETQFNQLAPNANDLKTSKTNADPLLKPTHYYFFDGVDGDEEADQWRRLKEDTFYIPDLVEKSKKEWTQRAREICEILAKRKRFLLRKRIRPTRNTKKAIYAKKQFVKKMQRSKSPKDA